MTIKDISNAELGDHFSFIYQNEDQLFSVLIPFFIKGLEKNQKCIYVVDKTSKQKIIAEFKKRNVNLLKFIKTGHFMFLTSKETYLKDGYFDPDIMINQLKQTEQQVLEEGYDGLRVTGSASWILSGVKGADRLIEYESKLCDFFHGSKTTAICQYDEKKLKPEILAESIHCHPEVIFYNKRCENLYYSHNLFANEGHKSFPTGTYKLIKDDFI
ncbi:MAG: MEDS domain-containing protein [Candidatus Micrarchaeota archaeon]